MPLQLAAALEQRLAELDRLDEPLTARDDLERPVALLVELHSVRDRPRLADQISRFPELLHDFRPRLGRGQPHEVGRSSGLRDRDRFDSQPGARPSHIGRSVPFG